MEIFIKQEYCESDVKFVIEQVSSLGETFTVKERFSDVPKVSLDKEFNK